MVYLFCHCFSCLTLVLDICILYPGYVFLCRDYLSPSDIMGNYPHFVILGTGLAFGFLVVRYNIYVAASQNL